MTAVSRPHDGPSARAPEYRELYRLVNSFAFVPLPGLTALILLLFPDGRPPSQRWRWVAWAIGIVVLVTLVAGLLSADADEPFSDPIVIQGPIEAVAQAVATSG